MQNRNTNRRYSLLLFAFAKTVDAVNSRLANTKAWQINCECQMTGLNLDAEPMYKGNSGFTVLCTKNYSIGWDLLI